MHNFRREELSYIYIFFLPCFSISSCHALGCLNSTAASTYPCGGTIVPEALLAGPISSESVDSFCSDCKDASIFACWHASEFHRIFWRLNVRYWLQLSIWKNPGAGGVRTTFCWEKISEAHTLPFELAGPGKLVWYNSVIYGANNEMNCTLL